MLGSASPPGHQGRVAIPPRPADTTEDAERVQVALLRAAPVGRRIALALSLSASVMGAARRAIGRSAPLESSREHDVRFVALHYGAELAEELRRDLGARDGEHRRLT